MERFDISEGERLADMVARAERGEAVEITRDGRVVARVTGAGDLRTHLEELHRKLPTEVLGQDWQGTLDEVRRGRFE